MHPSLLFYTKVIILNCSNIVSNNGNRFKILKNNCKQSKLMFCYKIQKLMHRRKFKRIRKRVHKQMGRKSNDIALEFKLKLINNFVRLFFLLYGLWKSSNIIKYRQYRSFSQFLRLICLSYLLRLCQLRWVVINLEIANVLSDYFVTTAGFKSASSVGFYWSLPHSSSLCFNHCLDCLHYLNQRHFRLHLPLHPPPLI